MDKKTLFSQGRVSVVKVASGSETPDAPYRIFQNFMIRLRRKYKDRRYLSNRQLRCYQEPFHRRQIAYILCLGRKIVGVSVGFESGNTFHSQYLVFDPVHHGEYSEKFIQILKSEFQEISFFVSAIGERVCNNLQRRVSRQKAAIRYYRMRGFKIDENHILYWLHRSNSDLAPMKWSRDDS